jgi:cation:H+ antiporter
LDYIYLVAGLIGLFFGGEALVRGSVGVARRLALPPLIIGLTVVGFGASTPELLVSVDTAWRGVPDISLGNIIGSNIASIMLIAVLTALVWPITGSGCDIAARYPGHGCRGLGAGADLCTWLCGAAAEVVLVNGLIGYLIWPYRTPGDAVAEDENLPAPSSTLKSVLWVIGGLIILVVGARFLVDGSVSIARLWGPRTVYRPDHRSSRYVFAGTCNLFDCSCPAPVKNCDRQYRRVEYL